MNSVLRKMQAIVLWGLVTSSPAFASDVVERLLSRDPIVEADGAFARGDKRHLVIPICGPQPGEVIPGWPMKETPEAWKALENGYRPIACADMAPDPKHYVFIRVAEYAAQYNRRLLELDAPTTK